MKYFEIVSYYVITITILQMICNLTIALGNLKDTVVKFQ